MQPRLRVLMCTPEVMPYSSAGGLGAVVGSLAPALVECGVDVRTISPLFPDIRQRTLRLLGDLRPIFIDGTTLGGRIWADGDEKPARHVFIEQRTLFDRPGIYGDPDTGKGYDDNFQRFLFFSLATLQFLRRSNWSADIVHCHDAHMGLIPAYLRYGAPPGTSAILFTIHNLAYQAVYSAQDYPRTGFPPYLFHFGGPFEFYGRFNWMKSGIHCADAVSTVSPTYAREIQEPLAGCGLDGLLRYRSADLAGILNGIDDQRWDPRTDKHLFANYSAEDLAGKAVNTRRLRARFGLPASEVPLIGMVCRLAEQKGFDLILAAARELMTLPAQWIFMGQGEALYRQGLSEMARLHPDRAAVYFEFDDALAHQIEAGSDLFLMPSRFEPCGLNQMYSMRYGTLPLVHATGGLADTVVDCADVQAGTGFAFRDYTPGAFLECVRRALDAWNRPEGRLRAIRNGMKIDFSWRRRAPEYVRLYRRALEKRASSEV